MFSPSPRSEARGEGWGEGLLNNPRHQYFKRTSSPRPSPPLRGGEGVRGQCQDAPKPETRRPKSETRPRSEARSGRSESFANRKKYPLHGILFVDVNLPNAQAFTFLEWMRRQVECRSLLVIAVSGVNDLRAVRRACGAGAQSFRLKPCRRDDLKNLMHWFPDYWLGLEVPPWRS